MDKCENCGRAIGALETPAIWDDHVVCAQCRGDLSKAKHHAAKQQQVEYARQAPPLPSRVTLESMDELATAALQTAGRPARTPGVPQCQQCGGEMQKKTISSGNCLGIAVALMVLTVGILMTLTGVAAIIGIPLCIVALFIGGKRSKVWKCRACGSVVPRA